jgi:hypothetical protein
MQPLHLAVLQRALLALLNSSICIPKYANVEHLTSKFKTFSALFKNDTKEL